MCQRSGMPDLAITGSRPPGRGLATIMAPSPQNLPNGDPLPFSEFEAGFRPMSRRAESLTVVLPTYHLVSCKLLTTAKFPLWPINQNLRTIRLSVPDPTACAFRVDTSRQLRPSTSTNSHSFPLQCYPHVSAQSLATTPSSREVFTSVSRSNHSYPGWDRIRG